MEQMTGKKETPLPYHLQDSIVYSYGVLVNN